jgi:hypothetical protein
LRFVAVRVIETVEVERGDEGRHGEQLLIDDVAVVDAGRQHVQRDAALGLAVAQRPHARVAAAIARQRREMQVVGARAAELCRPDDAVVLQAEQHVARFQCERVDGVEKAHPVPLAPGAQRRFPAVGAGIAFHRDGGEIPWLGEQRQHIHKVAERVAGDRSFAAYGDASTVT